MSDDATRELTLDELVEIAKKDGAWWLEPSVSSTLAGSGHLKSILVQTLGDPDWAKAGKTHDWRNHVAGYWKDNWRKLSIETRFVLFHEARKAADREEWE